MQGPQPPLDAALRPGAGLTPGLRSVLLDTPGVHVRRVRHGSSALVVTFGNLVEDGVALPAELRPGFGEAFLDRDGVDAIHVVPRGNDWYCHDGMPEVLAAIRAAAGDLPVLAYGSSMGAYAALRFGAGVGASAVVALSPQASLDRRVVPWEQRWRAEAAGLRFPALGSGGTHPPALVLFDPHNPDAGHAALWAAARPVTPVPVPYAGHPAATFLAETGQLAPLVRDVLAGIAAGRPEMAALGRQVGRLSRARRARSGQYLQVLATAQPPHRRRLQLRLMQRAAAAVPGSSVYATRLAILLYRAGRMAEAEAEHRRAVALHPDDPAALFPFSLFLQRLGRWAEALVPARHAAAARPGSAALARHAALLARLAGPPHPLRPLLRLHNAVQHRLTRLAWQRGWRPVGRLERPG